MECKPHGGDLALIRPHYYTVPVSCWRRPAVIRLAVLTDLHNNLYGSLIKALELEAPDLILIAGDMVNRPTGLTPPRFTRGYGCAAKLAARWPVYYAPGNHESTWEAAGKYAADYRQFRRALEKKGVVFLNNDSASLGDEDNPLTISGLALGKEQFTHHRGQRKAPSADEIREILGPPRPFQILLAHHPAYLQAYAEWGADLVLSGHYHGGHGRLPFAGGVIGPGFELFPPYTKGLYREGGTQMIVSAGMGTHTIPLRVFNPREIPIIDLVGK